MALIEKALPLQLRLELFKGQMQIPHPIGIHSGGIKLILPVPGKYRHPSENGDHHTVLGPEPKGRRLPPKHDTAKTARLVLQRKVMVARRIHLVIRQLSPDKKPGESHIGVQQALHMAVELGH